MNFKYLALFGVISTIALTGTDAEAEIFEFTFTDIIAHAENPLISVGDVFTLKLYADNGSNSLVEQTWNIGDLLSFTISAGSYFANHSTVYPDPLTNNFQTDSSGKVSKVQFYGDGGGLSTDNFATCYCLGVDGNGPFYDGLGGLANRIQADGWNDVSKWSVAVALDYPEPPRPPAIPEPSTWALLLMGFGTIGALLRRRGPERTIAWPQVDHADAAGWRLMARSTSKDGIEPASCRPRPDVASVRAKSGPSSADCAPCVPQRPQRRLGGTTSS